ncbi:MAG: B12-binding domain-containing radical SAM protein, partial [Candidatus Methylomirabilales bacterium]
MKVYLVYPDVTSFHGLPYHPGLASIAAVLQEHGHEVKIGYLDSVEQYKGIVDLVESFEPDVVGFTTVETQFIHVQRLAAMIKAKRNCVVICGGTYMTLAPEAALEPASKSLDGIIRGDGEYALLELVEKVGRGEDYHDVYNLCYVDPRTGRLVQNPLRPAIGRLEDIPHPVTDLFEYQKIIDEHNLVLFHFSRGCPYPCTYCSARVLMTQYGQSVRYRSVDSTIEE